MTLGTGRMAPMGWTIARLMIMALVMTVTVMLTSLFVNNFHFRINVSLEIQFVHVLLSCACNFSFYEKVQPFPGIMTLNMVGPMVTLLFFKLPLYFK